MTLLITGLINFWAPIMNVDPHVALAVVEHESHFNPDAIGKLNEQGLFQLRPEFFKQYTLKQLRDPYTNISVGLQYLAKMKKECIHKKDITYLICFNAGKSGARKIKHPELFSYVKAIKRLM